MYYRTVYLYSDHNKHMFDITSGVLTVINIVIRILTITGLSYCVAEENSINDSNKALLVMFNINVIITTYLILVFISMIIYICIDCPGDFLKNSKNSSTEVQI